MPKQPQATCVRAIDAAQTIPLRHAVLRPGRPVSSAHFSGDAAVDTRHFGAFRDERLLSVASLFLAEMPGRPGVRAYQLRGMATEPSARGIGLGRLLVQACVDFARAAKAEILWCNARTSAAGFYQKHGFQVEGAEFEIPDVGPHYVMWLKVEL
jgi:GNAT superfamily N-acetyltransferase